MVCRPALWRIPGLLRPGFAVDHIEYRGRVPRLFSHFTCGVFAASLVGVPSSDTFQIAYQKFLSHLVRDIATAQPITPGTGFQGTIGEVDIERVIAVLTVPYWLAYGLEFALKGSHTLLLLGKLLVDVVRAAGERLLLGPPNRCCFCAACMSASRGEGGGMAGLGLEGSLGLGGRLGVVHSVIGWPCSREGCKALQFAF